ncbi:hypothetical protein NIM87_13245 [Devosia sp. XJ19-1]|uniref:Uncharacterized protein n=1 Tax=Devosia ureilytica TaxID=2952754 RepID=A0A9Q4AQ62_9HYPH|nr:hypothetical protein [Devosia ureilytica]MCP8884479.1 hypothetical protein [Devosia ureilytica]MCP8888087.1 hypothetical protein [Devosia ureilytica]
MTALGSASPKRRSALAWLVGVGIIAVLLAANAHLIYVAFASQPDCVSHLKVPDGSTDHFRAAKSGC